MSAGTWKEIVNNYQFLGMDLFMQNMFVFMRMCVNSWLKWYVVLLDPSGRFSYKICVAKKETNHSITKIERKMATGQGNAETSGLHSYICVVVLRIEM